MKSRPLDRWRETLALLAAYAAAEEWPGLCEALARRLAAAGLPHAATLTYICAGDVEATICQWTAQLGAQGIAVDALQVLSCSSFICIAVRMIKDLIM